MLFSLIDLLLDDPIRFLAFLPIFILTLGVALLGAITVHEFSHALVADRLGDGTPRRMGRLTLNPLAHLDPLGTLLLFIVGFGWGKPVQVNPLYLRAGYRRGMALVSFAGPASNIVAASLLALPIKLGMLAWYPPFRLMGLSYDDGLGIVGTTVALLIVFNIILSVFNLIPISPLDGFKVALGILPRQISDSYARTELIGPFILLGIIVLDNFSRLGLLSLVIRVPANFIGWLLVGRPLFF